MVSKVDPSTLWLKWSLRGDFELHVHVPAPDGQSGTVDHLGTVTQMGPMTPLSPGTDENKALELIMLVRTSTQEADAAPYGLQLTLVDFSDLNSDLKAACSKTVAASPSLYQVASQLLCFLLAQVDPRCMSCCHSRVAPRPLAVEAGQGVEGRAHWCFWPRRRR